MQDHHVAIQNNPEIYIRLFEVVNVLLALRVLLVRKLDFWVSFLTRQIMTLWDWRTSRQLVGNDAQKSAFLTNSTFNWLHLLLSADTSPLSQFADIILIKYIYIYIYTVYDRSQYKGQNEITWLSSSTSISSRSSDYFSFSHVSLCIFQFQYAALIYGTVWSPAFRQIIVTVEYFRYFRFYLLKADL